MADRGNVIENVIKGLECRKNAKMRCGNPCEKTGNCKYAILIRDPSGEPYYPYICDRKKLCEDALSLLKAQEPEKPIYKQIVNEHEKYTEYINRSFCAKCGAEFIHRVNYCPRCGKAVKWDG